MSKDWKLGGPDLTEAERRQRWPTTYLTAAQREAFAREPVCLYCGQPLGGEVCHGPGKGEMTVLEPRWDETHGPRGVCRTEGCQASQEALRARRVRLDLPSPPPSTGPLLRPLTPFPGDGDPSKLYRLHRDLPRGFEPLLWREGSAASLLAYFKREGSMTEAQKSIEDLEKALSMSTPADWWVNLIDGIDKMSDAEAVQMLEHAAQQLGGRQQVLATCKASMETARRQGHRAHEVYWSRLLQRLSRAAGL